MVIDGHLLSLIVIDSHWFNLEFFQKTGYFFGKTGLIGNISLKFI